MEAAKLEKQGIIPLDPNNRSSWRNIPCPVDLAPIQAELARVGGVNEFGEPNFIIVWGQDYRTWDLGKMRIHFSEDHIPAIHTPNRYAVREEVYQRAMNWLTAQNARRKQAFLDCNWSEFNRFPDFSEFLRAELSADYMRLPSNIDDMTRLAKLMPPGWRYLPGLHTFEHIGQQVFYVLQWFSPAEFGSSKEWDKWRFGAAYYPETDREENLIDINGEYPHKGQYENVVLRIGEKRTGIVFEEKELDEFYGYKEPTFENVIEPLKELLRIRNDVPDEQKTAEYRTSQKFKQFREQREIADRAWRDSFRQRFNDAKPVGGGNPTNISANKNKFDQ